MMEKPSLESQLVLIINKIMKEKDLEQYISQSRCSYVCDKLVKNFPNGWEVKTVSKHFVDYSGLVNGSHKLTIFHVFLIVCKNKRYFLVDPTFGQFTQKKEIFIHEISKNNKNKCAVELQKYNLDSNIFSFFINEIAKEIY